MCNRTCGPPIRAASTRALVSPQQPPQSRVPGKRSTLMAGLSVSQMHSSGVEPGSQPTPSSDLCLASKELPRVMSANVHQPLHLQREMQACVMQGGLGENPPLGSTTSDFPLIAHHMKNCNLFARDCVFLSRHHHHDLFKLVLSSPAAPRCRRGTGPQASWRTWSGLSPSQSPSPPHSRPCGSGMSPSTQSPQSP